MSRPGRLAAALLTLGLLAAPGPAAAATPVAADETTSDGVVWSLQPADEAGPDGRVSVRLELAPGDQAQDHLALTNYSDHEVTFALDAGDGVIDDGEFDVSSNDTTPTDGGSWVQIDAQATVAAGQTAIVPFTVTVPDDATPGDHPAGIVASVTSTGTDESGAQVQMMSRVGVRLHLRVTGEIVAGLAAEQLVARYVPSLNPFAPGRVELTYVVASTGNVRLGMSATATTHGWTGPTVSTADSVREILPGGTVHRSVVLEDVWPTGRLTTALSLAASAVGDDAVLVDPELVGGSVTVWAVPWTQLALVVAVVLLVLGVWWLRRRSRRRFAAALAAARAEGAAAHRTSVAGATDPAPATH